MTTWRPSQEDVRTAEAAAHLADEAAEAAGLLLADAVVAEVHDPSRIALLSGTYRTAKAEAVYRWSVLEDALAQFLGGRRA